MKLRRHKIKALASYLFSALLFSIPLVAQITRPSSVAAAVSTTITNSDGTACYAHIEQDSLYNSPETPSGNISFFRESVAVFTNHDTGYNTETLRQRVGVKGSPEESVYKTLNGSGDNIMYIYFSAGPNPGANGEPDKSCLDGMRLFQDPLNGTRFVGWSNVKGTAQGDFLEATYIPSDKAISINGVRVSFTPNPKAGDGVSNSDGSTQASIDLILSASTLNPTSGGGNSPGTNNDPCSDITNPSLHSSCLTPAFVDVNTIAWLKEEYTLGKWAGSQDDLGSTGMRYYLTKANEVTHHASDNIGKTIGGKNVTPYLQIRTEKKNGNAADYLPFNVDSFNVSSLKDFFSSFKPLKNNDSAWWDGHLHYVDFDTGGNSTESTVTVTNYNNMRAIATYFPSKKEINITIGQTAGGNEARLKVPYVNSDNTDSHKFESVAQDSFYANSCGTATAVIQVDSSVDLTKVATGRTMEATWTYVNPESCNNPADITAPIIVTVASSDQIPQSDIPTESTNTAIAATCESETGWVGWIACPFIKGISAAIEWVDNTISSSLQADIPDTVDTSGESTRTQMHLVWSNIRNIAYAILVPMMLLMVISSALNMGPFDAYSIKKSLPRMVMAVIFIALSWNICLTIIDIINSLGIGVKGIIEHPFNGGNPITLATVFEGSFASFVEQFILVGAAIGAAIYFLIFSFPIVLMSLMMAFMVLVLRRIIIIALFLAAPIAILSWVFPANNKVWKGWWSSFSKLLLVYPMIMALMAVGHVFAYILGQGHDGGIFNFIFRTLAYIMPLAFIPASFKLAGGMFSTITGAFQDKSKGLFDRARKGRGAFWHRTQEGRFFKNAKVGGRLDRLNTAFSTASNVNKYGKNPLKWGARAHDIHRQHAMQGKNAMLEDKAYTFAGDDDWNLAATVSKDEAEMTKNLRELRHLAGIYDEKQLKADVASFTSMRQHYGKQAFKSATLFRAMAGGTAVNRAGKLGAEGRDWRLLAKDIATTDDGHVDTAILASLIGQGRGVLQQAGQTLTGGNSFGNDLGIALNATSDAQAMQQGNEEVIQRHNMAFFLGDNVKQPEAKAAMDLFGQQIIRNIGNARAGNAANISVMLRSIAQLDQAYNASGSLSAEKRDLVQNQMRTELDIASMPMALKNKLANSPLMKDGNGNPLTSGKLTLSQVVNELRADSEFQQWTRQYEKEWQGQIAAQAQQAQQNNQNNPLGTPPGTNTSGVS